MARALFLYNPAARSAPTPSEVLGLVRQVAWGGFAVEVVASRSRGDLTREAASAASGGFDRVVACGGDGTVREVAQGLKGSGIPLALIPLGTANVVAREIGLPSQRPLACAREAGRGKDRPITLGDAGGEAFTFAASVGLDARTVEHVDLKMKREVGAWAYVYCGLRECLSEPETLFLVELSTGERLEGAQVFALNARRYGLGSLTLSAGASLESPTLRLVVLRGPLAIRLPLLLPHLLQKGIDEAPGVVALDAEGFRIVGPVGESVQGDGDPLARLPVEFRALPGALRLVFPR